MTDFVLGLGDPDATLPRVGGKGASLARLVAAGAPVPGGFHVTTAAYDTPSLPERHCEIGFLMLQPVSPR